MSLIKLEKLRKLNVKIKTPSFTTCVVFNMKGAILHDTFKNIILYLPRQVPYHFQ